MDSFGWRKGTCYSFRSRRTQQLVEVDSRMTSEGNATAADAQEAAAVAAAAAAAKAAAKVRFQG